MAFPGNAFGVAGNVPRVMKNREQDDRVELSRDLAFVEVAALVANILAQVFATDRAP